MHHDEIWQIYSRNGERIMNGGYPASLGNPSKESGLVYGAVALWLYRKNKGTIELLWQHRSMKVDRNPGKWDLSAAGHINYGESKIDAAIREAHEEIGVSITADDLIFSHARFNNYNNFYWIYFVDWTDKPDDFYFDDDEVSEVKWVPIEDLDDFVKNHAKAPLSKDYVHFEAVKDWLKENA